jgi:hypothetical protein
MISLTKIVLEIFNKVLQQSKTQMFFIGLMVGLVASWLYLLAGGSTWLFVPLWAEVIFYPGFFVGGYCYYLFGNSIAILLGTMAVGLFYGIFFVIILLLGRFLRYRKKYFLVLLCTTTVIVGVLFLKKLFLSSDMSAASYIKQDFTLKITSDQPEAKVYPLQEYWNEPPKPIATTPLELKGFYRIDRVGTGWVVSGRGIRLKATEEGFLILLDCIVAKNGYICKDVAPVLATISKNSSPAQLPSELKYHANLIPEESPIINKVGSAVMVNGVFLEVEPPSLKLNQGVYLIDIKGTEQ